MKEYISFDSHKHYTLAEREERASGRARQCRIDHHRGAICRFLRAKCEPGTPVAVEAIGNWYWIVDEIERAGLKPLLVHPRKAKLMMGQINKTDKLDVHGLNRLQRNDVLPTVWIPPGELRELDKYALTPTGVSDVYGRKGRQMLDGRIDDLPPNTAYVTRMLLERLDSTARAVSTLEARLKELVHATPQMKLLMTLPGIGVILSATIVLEIGDVGRFAAGERLASYAGTTPRVHASGGKVRTGRTRPDVNRYLKWAFAEAGNSVAVNHKRRPDWHVSRLYARIRQRRGHAKAVGAVARHLAEASFHVLTKKEDYRDPELARGRAREA